MSVRKILNWRVIAITHPLKACGIGEYSNVRFYVDDDRVSGLASRSEYSPHEVRRLRRQRICHSEIVATATILTILRTSNASSFSNQSERVVDGLSVRHVIPLNLFLKVRR